MDGAQPPDTSSDEVPPDEAPSDEAPAGPDDDSSPVPPEGEGGVGLSDQEIADIVRWGRENNRPTEDILADLEAENLRRGGSGPVDLPEGVELPSFEQFETPAGTVTLTAEEAADYREALRRTEQLPKSKEMLAEEMRRLEGEAGAAPRSAPGLPPQPRERHFSAASRRVHRRE